MVWVWVWTAGPGWALDRLPYRNPDLVVDLGVGLWAWPVPADADGDGDYDLLVSCPDKPSNGVWLFENVSGDTATNRFPVFRPGRKISATQHYVMPSYGPDGGVRVLTPGVEHPGFLRTGLKERVDLGVSARFYTPPGPEPKGPKIRHNQWRYADYDGDGALDLVVGVEDWSYYGWDDAWNAKGEWTHGPLHGFVFLLRNGGTAEKPVYGEPRKLEAGGTPIDVFGCPSPNLGDFDGDGDLDLVCGEFLDGFTYFENAGARREPRYLAGRRLTADSGRPLRMDLQMIVPVAFDWDRDGDLDLVVGDEDGRVALVENTGHLDGQRQPVFREPRYFQQEADTLKCGALATPVGVDWDGDGDQDILSGNTAGYIEFFENLSGPGVAEPRWGAPRRLEAGGRVFRVMAGPNGSIQGPAEAKWGYTTLSVADWDLDGLPDIVLNSIWGRVQWLRNIGSRTAPRLAEPAPVEVEWEGHPPKPAWTWWEPGERELVTQWRTTPVVYDVTGDGLPDLVMLDPEGYLALYERYRKGDALALHPARRAFVDEQGLPLRLNAKTAGGSGRRKLCMTDWDGDGIPDLLLNSANADLHRGLGPSGGVWRFQRVGSLAERNIEGHDVSPGVVDFDGDGIPDFLGGAEDGRFYFLRNPRSTAGNPAAASRSTEPVVVAASITPHGPGTATAGPSPAVEVLPIGLARRDITPSYPVRLTGYAARTNLSEGRMQALWAKALVFGADAAGDAPEAGPQILLTVDNCGVPAGVVEEVAGRLALKHRIRRSSFAVASSHTHSGPMVRGFAENIFIRDLTAEEAAASDRYTRELTDHLEAVAEAALASRRPGRLLHGQGKVGFAANRRTPGGPVDHSLPILVAQDLEGRILGVVANYACHCTTLGSQINRTHGDWAGFAQEFIESDHPGAVAMITIGCGADSNPSPRGGDDYGITWARTHARALATEVSWLAAGHLTPLPAQIRTSHQRLWLPLDPLPTREEWEVRAKESAIVGYHARKNLARLDRGETLPTRLPYFVQSWSFGDRLSMVFLAGEVVVDYVLRLKREFDPERLWVSGYANDVPCYIPSRRILAEGGYEAESSLWYYDRPARLSGEIEDLIHQAATNQIPAALRVDPKRAELPPPRSPEDSLQALRTRPDLRIDLVAAEPLIASPVAIDFGADGRLWVCEMRDYPEGMDGKGTPGGRVSVLSDTDGDGRYDRAKVVAEGLPFPTGLMAWGDGVLVAAAPEVLFVKEGDPPARPGDTGRVWRRLTGFATHNYQARVNGFRWGMDGWVYGSGGLFGGKLTSVQTGREIEVSGRDFRWHPETGELEALAGVSQQGRIRDDFGEWFGNDNSTLLWHFPLADRYTGRNPHMAPPEPRSRVNRDDNRVFPRSRTLARFNDPQAANQLTSACGPEIYRDDLLGREYQGNAFVCEPVHNLVRRALLDPEGVSFAARRAPDERDHEFLASTDNWFRPVEVRTGPDGGLWVVDMYRFVVEHPRWITAERLRELDVRAGADRGRIYRIRSAQHPLRPWPLSRGAPVGKGGLESLARRLDSPNGVVRDLAQREAETLLRGGKDGDEAVAREWRVRGRASVLDGALPVGARLQWLHLLGNLGWLEDDLLGAALGQGDARWIRSLLPLTSGRGGLQDLLVSGARKAAAGSDPGLAMAYCLALGDLPAPAAGPDAEAGSDPAAGALAGMARWRNDPWVRAAWLSSATTPARAVTMFQALDAELARDPGGGADAPAAEVLVRTLAGQGARRELGLLARELGGSDRTNASGGLTLGLQLSLAEAFEESAPGDGSTQDAPTAEAAARLAQQVVPLALASLSGQPGTAPLPDTAVPAAIRLLGRQAVRDPAVQDRLLSLLDRPELATRRPLVISALGRSSDPGLADRVLSSWGQRTPAARSGLLGLLLGRDAWLPRLGQAVVEGGVAPSELDPSQRVRLLERCGEELRQRLRERMPDRNPERAAVVKAYAVTETLTGDPSRGGEHFDRLCATCHRVRGRGNAVGPDLAPFAVKPTSEYLVAILDPNAALDPRFVAYDVVLRDGRELSGIVRSETGTSLVVAQAGGVLETVLRSEVRSMQAQGRSLMPEGLEQGMVAQDFADLVAWLRTVPPGFGTVTPEVAQRAREAFLRGGVSRVTSVSSGFAALPYPSWLGRLPLHYCRQTDGRSRLEWKAQPLSGSVPGGSMRFRFAVAMGFHSQPAGDFELQIDGKPVTRFGVTLSDGAWADVSGHVRVRYTAAEIGTEDTCGMLEIEMVRPPGPDAAASAVTTFSVTGSAAASERWFGLYHPVE